MIAASRGTIDMPPRLIAPLIDESGLLGLMPGSSAELGSFGAKVISLLPTNPGKGRPAIQGFVALFDLDTGTPVAIIDGAEITAIRTAAASGLATRLLARENARTCGIFGTGVQAVTHIDAMASVRTLSEVVVWGRDAQKARDFAAEQGKRTGLTIAATVDAAEAGSCDIVCTVTGSSKPVLKGEWVQTGAHINLVGAHTLATREADTALVQKTRVYTDLMESLHNEGGDIMIPIDDGAIDEDHIIGELGQLCAEEIEGRKKPSDITLYKSHGINAQDMYAASYIYDRARDSDLGTEVEFQE